MKLILSGNSPHTSYFTPDPIGCSRHNLTLSLPRKKGRILLYADLFLSDTLVPTTVLAFIPAHVEVRFAHNLTVIRLEQGDRWYAAAPERKRTFSEHPGLNDLSFQACPIRSA
ncbi:hypothetical protein K503DRAFT_870669 [Rhizopogon vinicolor AM-OR11-026]|uniref:Uncharacterized protein n=1 Tax=Rhizopogon vinicolor AM-OR11-026 TaxID=1314800 RepID=A0A1B7MFF8_9AGAM|nr:hypothetical protein K503DRAFT_870669 [Rhizopogon vinicolor AM-OR11-026]